MSRRRDDRKRNGRVRRTTDPTTVPGTIVDPFENPYGRNTVVADMSNAVLLDTSLGAILHITRDGQPDGDAYGLTLAGRVNQRVERAEVLFLTDLAGAVSIAAELTALAIRAGQGPEFLDAFEAAVDRLPT